MTEPIHIISLGAGVQSSTMALMAASGEITPLPEFAVFADTGDEPKAVYEWLSKLCAMLPFPVHMAYRRNGMPPGVAVNRLSDHLLEYDFSQIPAFMRSPTTGKATIGKRQCTRHWKIIPVYQKIREILGTSGKRMQDGAVVLWQGISVDEIGRMKPSREPWIAHRHPLIESGKSREDCTAWLTARGLYAPKSACVYCPYKDRKRWQADKQRGGEDWQTVKRVSDLLAMRGEYLTADLKPIDETDFTQPIGNTKRDEEPDDQLHLFGNECEGMCGV